jgi:outer membrane protein OmpA-like peptidoglycan-associated protein
MGTPVYRRVFLATVILATISACTRSGGETRRLEVFFTADSAALDDNAQSVIRQASEVARSHPLAPIRVLGLAAPDTGSAAFNHTLAQARAQNVADGLATAGVPQSQVRIESRGAVPFNMMPIESRRVEIAIDL